MTKLSTNEIANFYLVSVAEQTGFRMSWSETLETSFSRQGPFLVSSFSRGGEVKRVTIHVPLFSLF